MNGATKVVFNTGILYVKLLVGMAIGLFTTRLVLAALGETDFGIYALVAGVVGMLGILNSSMTNASMRFMAHSLGIGDEAVILKTFNTTLFLHFVIGIIAVILIELGGLIMFQYLLNIPESKFADARIVFHFMVITTFVTIISVPYDAVMNSHENFLALSLVDMLGYIIKLGIATYLTYSSSSKLLVLYGLFILLTQILLRIIKQLYCRLKYNECKFRFKAYVDKTMMKAILSFSGWNLFGSIAAMSVTQIRGVLLNMFFGVAINTADGISKTASAQVNTVSTSMTRALNPQLVKSEGGGDRQRMLRITELATKFSVFLFALFAIPVIIETSYLLNLWLIDVPEHAVIFCKLILIGLLIEKFTFEITSAIRAVGQIRNFQVAETCLIFFNIPIAYIIFKMGYPPYTIFLVSIFIAFIAILMRLYFGHMVAGMDIRQFFRNGILPILIPVLFTFFFAFMPKYFLLEGFLRLCITTMVSIAVMTSGFWFWGLKQEETAKLKEIVTSMANKVGLFKVTYQQG